jgi:SAM-dependent methyltransferase
MPTIDALMELDLAYVEPRLVALYDRDNPRGPDTDFYVSLVAEVGAETIIDFGCGTGLLTRELAIDNRQVIGVDPSPAMLAVARQGPGADRVQWIEGDASALPIVGADAVVMSGNVAQVFLEDSEWSATLRALHAALRPGGYLAFESRNPMARAWERWNREATYERFDSPNGPMECWLEVISAGNERVRMEGHNVFLDTGEDLVAPNELRFRTLTELTRSLTDTDFEVEHVYGNWNKEPVADGSDLFIIVARRR